jgi:hypothetical protein
LEGARRSSMLGFLLAHWMDVTKLIREMWRSSLEGWGVAHCWGLWQCFGSVFIFPDPDPEVEAGDQYGSGSNTDPGLQKLEKNDS